MDCFEILYPGRQLVLEVDHSSGHAKQRENGLYVSAMNVTWGKGKGAKMRSTVVTDDCLGDRPARLKWKCKEIDCKLEAGQTQHMCFQPGDPPPFYDPDAPEKDEWRKVKNKRTRRVVEIPVRG